MGRIAELILKELGDLKSVPNSNFKMLATSLENKILPLVKAPMPKVDTSKDIWMKKLEAGVSVSIQGKNKKYTLKGSELQFFIMLYAAYGYKHGRNEAAGAFVSTVVLGEFVGLDGDDRFDLSTFILKAAKRDCDNRDPERTVKMLQGWITAKRWED